MSENFAEKCASVYKNTIKNYQKDADFLFGDLEQTHSKVATKGNVDKEVDVK